MIKKLKDILNSYTDEELDDMEIWIDGRTQIDSIWIKKNFIDIITRNCKESMNKEEKTVWILKKDMTHLLLIVSTH